MANYVSNYTGKQIDTILTKADTIPSPTAQDVNKILSVGQNGIEWVENSGGSGSSELPEYDFAESGKILAVTSENGEPELTWENYTPIPDAKNNQGKILKVTNDNGTLAWQTENTGIPSYSNSDEGKVLGISNNAVTWITNAGGGSDSGGGIPTPSEEEIDNYSLLVTSACHDGYGWESSDDFIAKKNLMTSNNVSNYISDALQNYTPSYNCGENPSEIASELSDFESRFPSQNDYSQTKYLALDSHQSYFYLKDVSGGNSLPKITDKDVGKILRVNTEGKLELVDPATILN